MRVLAMDGGGSLSLLTLLLIRRIEAASPGFLESVDVLAGTSAGGINALLLASRPDPVEALEVCCQLWDGSTRVFLSSPLRRVASLAGQVAFSSPCVLEDYLRDYIGDKTLAELHRKVVIPSFKLRDALPDGSWGPELFVNLDLDDLGPQPPRAIDVALSTGATPIFWPTHQGYADGGIFANNPSLAAVAHLIQVAEENKSAGDVLSDIAVLSIGTGQQLASLPVQTADLGWCQWMFDPRLPMALLEAVWDSSSLQVDYECRQLLGTRGYWRLNPPLNDLIPTGEEMTELALADFRGLAEKIEEAANSVDIQPTIDWLKDSTWTQADKNKPANARRRAKRPGRKKPTRGKAG